MRGPGLKKLSPDFFLSNLLAILARLKPEFQSDEENFIIYSCI